MLAVNVLGVFLCYRKAAKAMIECDTAKSGRIIGACSQAGKKGPNSPLYGWVCKTFDPDVRLPLAWTILRE
jgi:NAD(P)-dependent dehydrogenase (short-subunit alcohol dehydrogenase family)